MVRDFVTAVNEKDGKAFCNEIATREYVEKVTAATGDSAIKQCESQIKQIRQPKYKVSKLVKTTVDGDRATVIARAGAAGPRPSPAVPAGQGRRRLPPDQRSHEPVDRL